MEKNFEKATRNKVRFETKRGQVSVEDVWDMPLIHSNGFSLDDLAKTLYKELKESQEESFVVRKNTKNEEAELKFEIVKYIISVKVKEKENKENEALIKAKEARLLNILEKKKNAQEEELSIEEVEAALASLRKKAE